MTSRFQAARHLRVLDLAGPEVRREADRRPRPATQPDLLHLFWEATLRDNLRCAHCGATCEPSEPARELTTAEAARIFDGIAEDFDPRRVFVWITGGEPLLRADLADLVTRLSRLGMQTGLVTNGTLLRDREAERLHAAGMRAATIGLDGLLDEHEAVRGPGTFRRALRGIAAARAAGFHVVEALTLVRPANLDVLRDIEDVVREAGADRWRLITIDRMGRGACERDPRDGLWLAPHQVSELIHFVESRLEELQAAGDRFDLRFSCGGFPGLRRDLRVRPRGGQCEAGQCVASILADGRVGACPSLPRSWAEGSALTERFSTIWRERFGRFRDTEWRKTGPCADCAYFDLCLGGGLHERLARLHEEEPTRPRFRRDPEIPRA